MKLNHSNSLGEHPVEFICESQSLIGIYHQTDRHADIGVLIYSGGFQTRTGAHRKFVELARAISKIGIAVFRFEPRGLGDSEGHVAEDASNMDDIKCAIRQFKKCNESLEKIVIMSMCDGASAALHYATVDSRISALILLNPWISRSENETALSVKKYYCDRLFSAGLWSSLTRRRNWSKVIADMLKSGVRLMCNTNNDLAPYDEQTVDSYYRYPGKILLVLSGNDMVAAEFESAITTSEISFRSKDIETSRFVSKCPDSDHTFSDRNSYDALELAIVSWLDLQLRDAC